jgi:Asp-tRNA(Asn)/Glu-tRNA(Gln) amidotransferase A subunit family amidase
MATTENSAAKPSGSALAELTATQAVNLIRDGSLKAESYAGILLERIERYKGLNTIAWIDAGRVLENARAVDQMRVRGANLGALAGLPIVVKDNISTVGFPTSAGTPSLRSYFPKANAPVIDALLGSGAIILAKANMHELALGGTSDNPTFGFVKNPYVLTLTPGGSSGGSAAAIGARLAPAGLGTDTAASVRMPAGACGIAGMRPSTARGRKLYSAEAVVPLTLVFDTIGPLGRDVADLALLNAAITGQPVPAATPLPGLRIGLPRAFYWEELDPGIATVSEQALVRLRDAGVTLVELDMTELVREASEVYFALATQGSKDLADFLAANYPSLTLEELIEQIASQQVKTGFLTSRKRQIAPEALERARAAYLAIADRYESLLRTHVVTAVVFPTCPVPPLGIGQISDRILIRNTVASGVWGSPGISIPVGLTGEGIPVGLEFDGLPGADRDLLSIGMGLEKVFGPLPPPPLPNALS